AHGVFESSTVAVGLLSPQAIKRKRIYKMRRPVSRLRMPETRRHRVGIMLSIETEHWHGVLQGLAEGFRAEPELQVIKIARPARFGAARLRRLQLDGLITRVGTKADEEALREAGLPVVNVSGRVEQVGLTNVINDDARVGELAGRFFARRGFRHFGFCGVTRLQSSRLRADGFHRTAGAAGAVAPDLLLPEMPEGDVPSLKA